MYFVVIRVHIIMTHLLVMRSSPMCAPGMLQIAVCCVVEFLQCGFIRSYCGPRDKKKSVPTSTTSASFYFCDCCTTFLDYLKISKKPKEACVEGSNSVKG